MKIYDCDICSGSGFITIEGTQAVICNDCGFLHVKERRSSEEIAQAWDELWGEAYSSKWPAVVARQHYVAEWCDQVFGWNGKRVLDVGAGEGHFIDIIGGGYDDQGYGANATGIDPSPDNANSRIYCSTIEDIPDTEVRFDVVTILWTLENCGDCIGMLTKARELLKPGGCVVVATGSRIMVPFKKPLSQYFSDNPPDLHCFRFSANSLQAAMKKAGLGLTQTNSYEDNDVLICVGQVGEGPPAEIDRPRQVQQFFRNWRNMWP
jgi:SAM-dependent methyltransferase